MMIFLLANTLFLLASVAYGWLAGDRHDREAVAWIVAAILGTFGARAFAPADARELVVLVIDIALLAAIISIALRSSRFWPSWFAAFQLVAVASSILILGGVAPEMMIRMGGLWGTAALLAMVGGLFLDRRATGAQLAVRQEHPST